MGVASLISVQRTLKERNFWDNILRFHNDREKFNQLKLLRKQKFLD